MQDVNPFQDVKVTAKALNISERHLRKMVARRGVPYVRIGNRLRFDVAEVKQFLKQKHGRKAIV